MRRFVPAMAFVLLAGLVCPAAKTVRLHGKTYACPLKLFDGVAEGPVTELAHWGQSAGVRLTVTEQGRRRGLATGRSWPNTPTERPPSSPDPTARARSS